jgi:hypothetical protein
MRKEIEQCFEMIRDKRYNDHAVYLYFVALFPIPCIDPNQEYNRVTTLMEDKRPKVLKAINALGKAREAGRHKAAY